MDEKRLFALLIILFIVGMVVLPKDIILEYNDTNIKCKCIGIKTDAGCFGKRVNCREIVGKSLSKDMAVSRPKGSNDIIILIDNSASMRGERFLKAKSAAEILISGFSDNDKAAIITFAENARIIQKFTSDKEELREVVRDADPLSSKERTNYTSAISLALKLFEESTEPDMIKKIIMLSDGELSSIEQEKLLYAQAEKLISFGICIYSLGYSDPDYLFGENIAENMADMSFQLSGCGRYYPADSDRLKQMGIFREIIDDTSAKDLTIHVSSPSTQLYTAKDIMVNFSTNINAECVYALDGGNTATIFAVPFHIYPKQGNNTLTIKCRRDYRHDWEAEKEVQFYVDYQANFLQFIKDFFLRPKEIKQPSKNEVKDILREAFINEELNVIQRANPKGKGTEIIMLIQNTKPVPLTNVRVRHIIPSHLINNIQNIESKESFSFLESSPLIIEFYKMEISPEEVTAISYYIDNPILDQDLASFQTEISYDPVTDSQLEDLFKGINSTSRYLDFSRSSVSDAKGTKGKIKVSPSNRLDDVKIYLNIPKCMAQHLNDIYFQDRNYKIIAEDPLILWHFDEIDDNITIEYEVDKHLDEFCHNKLSVLAMADEVGEPLTKQKKKGSILYLLPVLLIPACIIILYIYTKKTVVSGARHRSFMRLFLIIGLIMLLLWVLYPKANPANDQLCECFGISTRDHCFGMPFECSEIAGIKEKTKLASHDFCPDPTCTGLSKYMKTDPRMMNEIGIDLTLIIDQSKSMEGDKMGNAKLAAGTLLSQLKEYDRISIISFDNSSRLIQQFSNDIPVIKDNLEKIDPGFTTKYVPALNKAYYNYLSHGNRFNKWQVIFISDGEPGDEGGHEAIYNKVKDMASEGICINTIGFGDEIFPGSNAETILKRMADISRESTKCGSYYYAPQDLRTLSDIIGRLYNDAAEEVPYIIINEDVNSMSLTTREILQVEANLFSSTNKLDIPGSFRIENNYYCVPEADAELILEKDGNIIRTTSMVYDPSKNIYIGRMEQLPIGDYDLTIKATIESDEGCLYYGNKNIGSLKVSKFEGFKECWTDTCYDVTKYLFTEEGQDDIVVLISDYAFMPQNVSITDGATVTWKNIGKKPHTVTSGKNYHDGFFHSGILLPGQSYNRTFEKASEFSYFDNLSIRLKGSTSVETKKDISFGNFKLEYKKPIDLVLVIDKSASMYGSRMGNVKNAAHKLIEMVYPGDRLALVEFSDSAKVRQTFTKDRILLNNMVDNIFIGGSTRYVPALIKAKELFDSRLDDTGNGKIIVFLSDGRPWDEGKPQSIYNAAKDIIEDGACIYTVGYGDEVYPGSEAERLLKQIVNMSQSSMHCGGYKYAPANEIKLVKIFGSIYHEAAGNVKGLVVLPDISKTIINTNQSLGVSAKVRSTFANNMLPGTINISGGQLCGPPAKVYARIFDDNNHTVMMEEMPYRGASTGYHAQIYGIPKGNHNLEIIAKAACSTGDLCEFTGSYTTSIVVLEEIDINIDKFFAFFIFSVIVLIAFIVFKNG